MKLQRRHWIGAGVALAAAGTGAWWSNRRHQPLPVPTEAETAFWEVSFEGPNGEAVRHENKSPKFYQNHRLWGHLFRSIAVS